MTTQTVQGLATTMQHKPPKEAESTRRLNFPMRSTPAIQVLPRNKALSGGYIWKPDIWKWSSLGEFSSSSACKIPIACRGKGLLMRRFDIEAGELDEVFKVVLSGGY
jgi:hypothetical protein